MRKINPSQMSYSSKPSITHFNTRKKHLKKAQIKQRRLLSGLILLVICLLSFAACSNPKDTLTDHTTENRPGNASDTETKQPAENQSDKASYSLLQKPTDTTTQTPTEEETLMTLTTDEIIEKYKPCDTVDVSDWSVEGVKAMFFAAEINDATFERMKGKSYKDDCTVPRDELRYVRVLHTGFDGAAHVGEMVVNKAIADDTLEILYELFLNEYPIERMVLIDEYDAEDELSMEANNSSSFNFRVIYGTKTLSYHARGLAIDINTLYNPYITTLEDGTPVLQPANAEPYVDRDQDNPYFIRKDDLCYNLFIEHGFKWGGDWVKAKDYQHFEKAR